MILVGDVLEMLATLPDESVNCVVTSPPYLHANFIQYGDPLFEHLHASGDFRRSRLAANMPTTCARPCRPALLFQIAEFKARFSLGAFDAQIREKCSKAVGGLQIRYLPDVQRASTLSAWVIYPKAPAKRVPEHCHGFRCYLLHADSLAEYRRTSVSAHAHSVRAPLYSNRSVSVNDASEVGKCQLIHLSSVPRSGGRVTTHRRCV